VHADWDIVEGEDWDEWACAVRISQFPCQWYF